MKAITFEQFLSIARAAKAYDILECWDEQGFNEYCDMFGPMDIKAARTLCRVDKAVTDDRIAAGEYFGQW